jgi:5-methylcytosine-specific restriction endonuclease McrA
MHKRKTHEDVERTKASRRSKVFLSRFSYWSTRIHPGTDHQCIYLAGVDCEPAYRSAIMEAKGRCQLCGTWTLNLEVDHIEHKTKASRCWCPENLRAICIKCHRERHPRVKWTPFRETDVKAYEALYENII